MRFADRLVAAWHAPRLTALTLPLVPLALLFGAIAAARRLCYRRRWFAVVHLPVPVVVVGNIGVGGTGKTPLVAALARVLAARGWHPGIVSRGHGGDAGREAAVLVAADADPAAVGDEPLLLARHGFLVAIGRDRVAAGRALLAAHPECNVVIADDGMQHYRLGRVAEVAVVDAARGFGNGWLLPAGPLRELPTRLATATAIVLNGADGVARDPRLAGAWPMTLAPAPLQRVDGHPLPATAADLAGRRVHAVAGIGHPQRFYAQLRALGMVPLEHSFPDHHRYRPQDIAFGDGLTVLMTEKDAVKCRAFADERCWYLPVEAVLDPTLVSRIEEKLRGPQAA